MTSYFWEVPLATTSRRKNAAVAAAAFARVAIAPLMAAYKAWSRYRTERILESLPMDIRKDVGYRTQADMENKHLK